MKKADDNTLEMELVWKQVCYTRARLPKYCFPVFVLSLLILASFLLLWNEGYDGELVHKGAARQTLSVESRAQQQGDVLELVSIVDDQEERRKTVQRVCRRNNISPYQQPIVPDKMRSLIVDEKHKFLYCEVPKVACTNWKRIMLILTGKMNTTNPDELKAGDVHGELGATHLRRLDTYNAEEIPRILNTYFKVMFVRHPLERLLSAYRNKFTTRYNALFPMKYGRKIIQKYRKNASEKSLAKGHDVKFEEFVKYLVDLKDSSEPYNGHWREYYKICHPCMVQYDVIGKYTTLDRDVDYVLKILGVNNLIHFPPKPQMKGPSTHDLLSVSYQNISSEEIHRLWEMYAVDFAMFDYPYPEFKN